QIAGMWWVNNGLMATRAPVGIAYPLKLKSRVGRRGIDGTGGFIRIASLNAISVSGIASRLSNVVGSPATTPSDDTSSRNLSCHLGWAASAPTNDVSDEVSVSCAAIIRKLMWS